MSKKISMQQIADRLGLSKFTISQALSGKPGVSEENRQRIEEAARSMGYVVRSSRVAVYGAPAAHSSEDATSAERQAKYILIWIHSAHLQETAFWGKVLSGIISATVDNGFEHLVIPVPEGSGQQLQIPSYVNRPACVGHILVGTFSTQAVVSLKQTSLPVVLVDHEEPLVEVDSVLNDNLDSGKMACKRLLSAGCKRIVFVGDDSFAVSFKERWWGCRLAMEDVAGPSEEFVLKKWNIAYNQSYQVGSLERKLLAVHESSMPDAFICANDHIALVLMLHLKQRNIDVPGQVKIVGFDNIEMSAYSDPPLSTVELAKESLGIRSVETLLYRIKHPGRQTEKIVLSSRFIVRDSG